MTVDPMTTLAGDYLSILKALCVEINFAMLALARNSSSDFRDSVARQESLCDEMSYLAQGLLARVEPPASLATPLLDPQFAARIRDAQWQLQRLNRCYADLLASASWSVKELSALCRSCLEQFQFATAEVPQQKTWSCEV
jgi:hypothetical protein